MPSPPPFIYDFLVQLVKGEEEEEEEGGKVEKEEEEEHQ